MKSPQNIPLAETVTFLLQYLRPPPARVLDVGCGTGGIAAALMSHGYIVEAIDTKPAAVALARQRCVPAVVASWPGFAVEDVMAILFIRALHHASDLLAAVERCRAALRPDGLILVEDFAFSDIPRSARSWVRTWAQRAEAGALLKPDPHPVIRAALDQTFPAPAQNIHTAATIDSALRQHFHIQSSASAPYYFRYLAESVLDTDAGCELVEEMLKEEKEALSAEQLWPLGRRWVGAQSQLPI